MEDILPLPGEIDHFLGRLAEHCAQPCLHGGALLGVELDGFAVELDGFAALHAVQGTRPAEVVTRFHILVRDAKLRAPPQGRWLARCRCYIPYFNITDLLKHTESSRVALSFRSHRAMPVGEAVFVAS